MMIKKTVLSMVALMVVSHVVVAQKSMVISGSAQEVKVEFFTPSIVHVVKGEPTKTLVVTALPEKVAVAKKGNTWASSELIVRQDGRGNLTFLTSKGKVLLREKSCDIPKVSQTFTLDKDEAIYGLGTVQNGKINRRGETKRMEQSNLEDFQNVLQSIKGWGIYWENYSPTLFEDNAQGMTFTSEAGEGIDYYFMYGGSADGVIAQMRRLSGDVPMFPLWTYGFWQSKERYKTAAETEGVVDKYRELQVPLDGIIQDWQYWGSNYLWNAMDFLAEDFATGPQMIKNVHKKHAHFMISIWASFGPMTQQFRELNEKGLLLPIDTWPQSGISHVWPPVMEYPSGVKVYDAFSPVARDIYWKYLRKLYDYGVDAWWMDSTDPDFFNPRESDYDHKVFGGTWRSQRNAFPLETVRGIYQSQRRDYANSPKRVFIMTRSSFAGQQHYGSNMWSGDVASSWDMLRKQVPAGLSFSLTGNPNFNTDIGGFFCGSYNTRGRGSAPQNPQFQELYVRWMQYGLFCPVFRSHGADAPREIWQFGKKGEPVYDAIEKMIRLRYRLIPYLYSTAWQVTSANGSYLRPLFSDFASDKKVWNTTDEFMFGRSILAAPIVDPQYTEEKVIKEDAMTGWDRKSAVGESAVNADFTTSKTAVKYLPKGALWYDFWTNKTYNGGQSVTLETSFDRVPMFVRAGSILPLGPEMQYVGEKAWDNLELHVYPGADGSFTLYEDEGDGYNYEKGVYSTITFHWNNKSRTLTIGDRKGEYPGMLTTRRFTVMLPDGTTTTVDYDGTSKSVNL